jgi:hypothetical protein
MIPTQIKILRQIRMMRVGKKIAYPSISRLKIK